jgi:hypothetical protein
VERERFDRIREEVQEYTQNLANGLPREPTLGEMAEDGSLAEGLVRSLSDPDFQRKQVAFKLGMLFGDPEKDLDLGTMGNPYGVGIISERHHTVNYELVGAFAARVYKKKKADNRLQSLREMAELCGEAARAFEERLQAESKIRRIQ